jgi:hypothetical protein
MSNAHNLLEISSVVNPHILNITNMLFQTRNFYWLPKKIFLVFLYIRFHSSFSVFHRDFIRVSCFPSGSLRFEKTYNCFSDISVMVLYCFSLVSHKRHILILIFIFL